MTGETKFCSDCGASIAKKAEICPQCGVRQLPPPNSSNALVKGCLIALIVVVVIWVVGILAAIAIPKFTNTKDKAYISAQKADLRNLATAEEQFAADNDGRYKSLTSESASAPNYVAGMNFQPSPYVTVMAVADNGSNPHTWVGTARHDNASVTCTMTTAGVITGC